MSSILPTTISPKAKRIILLSAASAVLALIGALVYIGRIGSIGRIGRIAVTPTPTPSPIPTPTPIPLAPGKQVYEIRSDTKIPGPQILQASFDPLDVLQGAAVNVEVRAKDAVSVSVTMIDDAGKSDHPLSQASGVWTGSWTVESTHNRIYGATITAVNSKGEKRTVELWFR